MTSVLDEGDLAGLMRMATLADRDFTAERASAKVIYQGPVDIGIAKKEIPDECKQLPIPERPAWTKTMRKDEVDHNEKEAFLNWRRRLAEIEEKYDVMLTPFEKNLEFWRQLWRVVEKSDVVVQVVDARNPMLYRSHALEEYVKKTGDWKTNVILFNKADLLPTRVRLTWARYLDGIGVKYFFFAAKNEIEKRLAETHAGDIPEGEEWNEDKWNEDNEDEFKAAIGREMYLPLDDDAKSIISNISMTTSRQQREYIMIGFVGYPNVGKSSTVNALCGAKKTKHFQTMIVSNSVMLCDCPGLVMPSVVASRGEMVCGGILPINVLKDHIEPMMLVAGRIPRCVFEEAYNINLPAKTASGAHREYVTWMLCAGYAVSRCLLTAQGGVPETHTAARQILKDFVRGKLRFCHMPQVPYTLHSEP
ncbi:P-loop containing nucleoside triphosphate hydrolase protein [Baffinella frigidus]|nr:P-loop containing nucleoside triphosphate hydrolase protein [Cryptophyta sp. CCMP2293]